MNELEAIQQVLEGLVIDDTNDEENLTYLDIEAKEIKKRLDDVMKRIRDIEDKRYERRRVITEQKREKQRLEMLKEEELRQRELEATRKVTFQKMIDYAKNRKFEWVDYALDHQWEGALTLAHHNSALLGDEAGLGKSMTALMYCDLVPCGYKDQEFGAKKIVFFVPNDVVSTFTEEVKQWAPHRRVFPVMGANKHMRELIGSMLNDTEQDDDLVLIVNYESVWKDPTWIQEFAWDVVIIDEAHNMKNTKGLTFDRISGMNSKHFMPMTGTFILNEPKDLFASLYLIDPIQFNDEFTFLYTYCQQGPDGKWTFQPGGERRMIERLKGRIVQRTYQDAGITLPEMHVREYLIKQDEIPTQQAIIQKQLKEYAGIALETGESINISAMIALITRERQAACYPAGIKVKVTQSMLKDDPDLPPVGTVLFEVPKDTPSVKLDIATKRLKTVVNAGKRCVVFSQFKTALADLEKRLTDEGIKVCRFDGDTKTPERMRIKKDFIRPKDGKKDSYNYDVVLANYKTGGVGLTFTEATYMLCLDEEWNPAKNHQAMQRIHRIGQTEETLVEVMRIEKSIDKWMQTLNEHKQAIVDGFNSEVDSVVESFKGYLQQDIEEKPQEYDQDFLDMLESM